MRSKHLAPPNQFVRLLDKILDDALPRVVKEAPFPVWSDHFTKTYCLLFRRISASQAFRTGNRFRPLPDPRRVGTHSRDFSRTDASSWGVDLRFQRSDRDYSPFGLQPAALKTKASSTYLGPRSATSLSKGEATNEIDDKSSRQENSSLPFHQF